MVGRQGQGQTQNWRKLHLGLDLVSEAIICSDLITDDVVDPTALLGLLDQISGPVTKFIADGTYDGAPTRALLDKRFSANLEVIIPSPKAAVLSPQAGPNPSVRVRHIAQIQTCGRLAWQKATGYKLRSQGKTDMSRWKTVIGSSLKARNYGNQKIEAKIGVRVLNRMTELGRPQFQRVT